MNHKAKKGSESREHVIVFTHLDAFLRMAVHDNSLSEENEDETDQNEEKRAMRACHFHRVWNHVQECRSNEHASTESCEEMKLQRTPISDEGQNRADECGNNDCN